MRPTDHLADAVLAYARLGYRVLPLHHPIQPAGANPGSQLGCSCGDRGCGSVGKHPLTPHGLYDATDDPARLAWWWRRWPQANIGLVTGQVADALDVDGLAGRAALRRWATEHGAFIDGPLVRTGTGWHFYLAPSGTGNRVGLLEHVDWRGAGGYVVAPPSQHHSGVRYRWLRPLTAALPEGPRPLRELLEPPRALQPQFRSSAPSAPVTRTGSRPSRLNSPGSPRRPRGDATTRSTRPGCVCTVWLPAASLSVRASRVTCSRPLRPPNC